MTQRSAFTNAIEGNNLPSAAGSALDKRDTTIHMYEHRYIMCAKHCDMIMQENQNKANRQADICKEIHVDGGCCPPTARGELLLQKIYLYVYVWLVFIIIH